MRRWLIVFLVVQLVGISCSLLWRHSENSFVWGTAFITLFPGDLLGEWIVEKLFWQSGLSSQITTAISTVLLFVINGIIWLAVIKTIQVMYARLFTRSSAGTPPAPKPTRS